MSIVRELKRRNVIKVAIAYAVVGWLLIEVTATVFPILKLPDWSVTLVTVFILIGFPLALILAWAFEITPEGIKREKDVDRSQSITHITGRNIDYLIITALVLALGFFAFDKFVLGPSRDAELVQATTEAIADYDQSEIPEKSIAVLPFTNRSSEQENAQFFADGVHDDLLTLLANLNSLTVISRTSVMEYRDTTKNMKTIGEELGVATILEGGVQRAGNQIRINVQLIDANTDQHIWAKTYDRTLTTETIFAIQSEIATSIAEQLEAALSPDDQETLNKRPTQNLEAYNAYLRGRHLVVQRTQATVEGAVREFEKAIALDPDYAVAHAELAVATVLMNRRNYGDLTITESITRAMPHAERAMALDPTLAEAHAATGFVLWDRGDLEETLQHFERAIQINSNYSIVYMWMANLLNEQLGRYAEAFAKFQMALRLDPLSRPAIINYIGVLIESNRLDEADRELEKIASIWPDAYAQLRGWRMSRGGEWANVILGNLDAWLINPEDLRLQRYMGWRFALIGLENEAFAILGGPPPYVLRMLGRSAEAVTIARERVADDPGFLAARRDLGLALASAGDYARARPILEEIWQRSGGLVTGYGPFEIESATALIAIRRDAGEEAEVDELVEAIRGNVRRYRETGFIGDILFVNVDSEEGLSFFLTGDREKGLALISKAVEDGFFIPQSEAYLQTLYDDPGFAPIRASQEARQKREREKFLAIVCINNPYAAVWQPKKGTCEQFAVIVGN